MSAVRLDAARWLVAALLSAPAIAEAEAPLRLLICQPGGPDLAVEQQSVIDKMYRYIERKTGLEKGRISGLYTNDRKVCLAELEKGVAIVIPSLPLYLEHQDQYGMVPVAQLELNGKVEDHFYLLVANDSPLKTTADLAGKTIVGTHSGCARFVLEIVLMGKVSKTNVTLVEERLGMRSVRKVAKGEAHAVLLDGAQYRRLAGTQFEKKLRVLHTSDPLPTPPVVVVEKNVPSGFGPKLGRVLVGMTSDPEGQEVVRLFGVEGFELPGPNTWASLEKRIKSAP
jgi:ABC-type phosphate/phosphonate transport system substrate-binding protein